MEAKKLIELIEDAGYEARSYGGRGMYGKECVGITCDNPISIIGKLIETINAAIDDEQMKEEIQEFAYILRRAETDSMGTSQILYFPSVEWVEDETEEG